MGVSKTGGAPVVLQVQDHHQDHQVEFSTSSSLEIKTCAWTYQAATPRMETSFGCGHAMARTVNSGDLMLAHSSSRTRQIQTNVRTSQGPAIRVAISCSSGIVMERLVSIGAMTRQSRPFMHRTVKWMPPCAWTSTVGARRTALKLTFGAASMANRINSGSLPMPGHPQAHHAAAELLPAAAEQLPAAAELLHDAAELHPAGAELHQAATIHQLLFPTQMQIVTLEAANVQSLLAMP